MKNACWKGRYIFVDWKREQEREYYRRLNGKPTKGELADTTYDCQDFKKREGKT